MRRQDEVVLLSQVETDKCIEWCVGKPNKGGYYYVRVGYRNEGVHRIAFEYHHGKLGVGEVVRHECDTPNCINPKHLIKGSQQDNMTDKVKRNRQRRGETSNFSQLTEDIVLEIREIGNSLYQKDIAERFNISQSLVSQILRRKVWKHI